MALDGATRERIDPKVLAALVNRFTADSADFLQAFARQAEAKLLHLGQRLERLERLVILFERKVQHLEPSGERGTEDHVPEKVAVQLTGNSQSKADIEVDEAKLASNLAEDSTAAFEDEKYAVYRRMHRSGVPLLAIRQRLIMDALQDPSLDVAVLDSFDGSSAGASAPLMQPLPSPPQPSAAEASSTEAAPEAAEPPAVAGPAGLAAAAAAMAQRRKSFAATGASPLTSTASMESTERPPAEAEPTASDSVAAATVSAPKPKPKPKVGIPKAPSAPKPPAAATSAPKAAAPAITSTESATALEQAGPAVQAAGLFAQVLAEGPAGIQDRHVSRPLPPPPKVAAKAAALTPEAALRIRRAIVSQVADDDAQSDVSDF